jgi:predicted secreted protein
VCQNASAVSKFISASANEEFEIVLEGVPTAGYTWEVIRPLQNEAVVEELGHEWQPSSSSVGGPAQEHFRFRALAPGEVQLRFRYRRPWEKSSKEERTFQVRVTSK